MIQTKEELFLAELGINTKEEIELAYGAKMKITELLKEYETKQLTLTDVVGQSEQLANFCKKISKQEDCPTEFQEIVNKEFWNLIG